MNKAFRIVRVMALVLSLFLSVTVLTVFAQGPASQDSPQLAILLGSAVSRIPPGGAQWFRFDYSFATYSSPRPTVTIRLVNAVQNGLRFEVWSPERLQGNWPDNKPVGRGVQEVIPNCTAAVQCATSDHVWIGGFGAPGVYYVRVINSSNNSVAPQLLVSGPGLGQCVNPQAGAGQAQATGEGFALAQCPNSAQGIVQAASPTVVATTAPAATSAPAATAATAATPVPVATAATAATQTKAATVAPATKAATSVPATSAPAATAAATRAATLAPTSAPAATTAATAAPSATATRAATVAPTSAPTTAAPAATTAPTVAASPAAVATAAKPAAGSQQNQVTVDITINSAGNLSIAGLDMRLIPVSQLPEQVTQISKVLGNIHLLLQGELITIDIQGNNILKVQWNAASRKTVEDLAAKYGYRISPDVLARVEDWITSTTLDITARYANEQSKPTIIRLSKPIQIDVGSNGQVSIEKGPLAYGIDPSVMPTIKQGNVQNMLLCWNKGTLTTKLDGKDLPTISLDPRGVAIVSKALGYDVGANIDPAFGALLGVDVALPGGAHPANATCGN